MVLTNQLIYLVKPRGRFFQICVLLKKSKLYPIEYITANDLKKIICISITLCDNFKPQFTLIRLSRFLMRFKYTTSKTLGYPHISKKCNFCTNTETCRLENPFIYSSCGSLIQKIYFLLTEIDAMIIFLKEYLH